jgi:hypothetical protein
MKIGYFKKKVSHLFGDQQEPCRINASELKIDYDKARARIDDIVAESGLSANARHQRLIELRATVESEYEALLAYREIGGSRGLNSKIASSRQVKGSQNEVVPFTAVMGDSLSMEVPKVPDWALSVVLAVEESQLIMLQAAKDRVEPSEVDKIPEEIVEALKTLVAEPSVKTTNVKLSSHQGTLLSELGKENKRNKATEMFTTRMNDKGSKKTI